MKTRKLEEPEQNRLDQAKHLLGDDEPVQGGDK